MNACIISLGMHQGCAGRTFLEMGKIQKNIFLEIKTSKIKSEKNIYQTIHNTRFIFYFFGIFTIFFVFFLIFWKKSTQILKKLHQNVDVSTGHQGNFLKVLEFFHNSQTCWEVWKNPKPLKKFTWWPVEASKWFFTHLSQGSPWPFV